MSLQSDKIEIAKTLLESNNKQMIQQMKAVMKSYKTDLWDELSDEVKSGVREAQAQLKKGQGIPHEKVMKKYKKWLTK